MLAKVAERLLRWYQGGQMLSEGIEAPQFSVLDHSGKKVQLSDYRGKRIILWFYPKADTPGWTLEGCGFRDRIHKFEEKNTVVLGVSFDTVEENRKFAEKFQFPFSLLCDTDRQIGIAYGACGKPTDGYASRIGYLIDEQGKITKAFPKIDAKSFPETLLSEL